MKLTGRSLHGG